MKLLCDHTNDLDVLSPMQSPMIKVKEVTEASLWKQYVRRLTAYVCSMFDLLNLNLEQTGELPEDCVLDDPCRPK